MSDSLVLTSKQPIAHYDKLALTRIIRWHQLSPETVNLVREALSQALGLLASPTNAGLRNPQAGARPVAELSNIPSENQNSKLTAKMRHLIAAGAPWHVVSDLLWLDFNSEPTPQKAARILETAFVQASPSETLEIFTHIMSSGLKGFYWFLHPKLRDFLVEHAPEQNLDQLYWVIARERNESKLSGIELTYIFLRVAVTSDKTAAWMYFRRHQTRIFEAFNTSKHFGMSKQQLIIRGGELALGLGYTEDARDLFQTIPPNCSEREVALQLLLRFETNTVDRNRNTYFVRVENAPCWQDKIALISGFCDICRNSGGLKDPNRSALDLLIKSIFQWVPKNAEAWRGIGELIVRHRDLAGVLPSIFAPLTDQAIIFHGDDIDGALWGPLTNMKANTHLETFFQGVAYLHKYTTNPRIGESLLWQAQACLTSPENASTRVPWTCRDLMKSACQWINQSTLLLDRDRKRALAGIRVALDGVHVTKESLETYFTHCTYIPEQLLSKIAANAAALGQVQFASDLLIKAGYQKPFTNMSLMELWTLASRNDSPDLAWRIATVLSAREALPATIRHAWEISGEHRSVYTPVNLTLQDVESSLINLSTSARRLVHSLCILGQKLNEYAHINSPASHFAPSLSGTSSIEQALVAALKNTTGIPRPTKTIVEGSGIHMIPSIAVPLAQSIINGPWLFAARLIAERLSISSWGWSVNILQNHVKSILPLIGNESTARSSAKLTNWLSSMNSQERAAWNDILSSSNLESSEFLSTDLTKFVCRLAVVMYPGHMTALKTLQQIRMPLEIVRDLEWFILSESLTALRKRHNICARVSIPETLKRTFT